jgi:hypothetical protein
MSLAPTPSGSRSSRDESTATSACPSVPTKTRTGRWWWRPGGCCTQPSQPAGSLVHELATGHLDRQAGELVFPGDLTQEPRAWPADTWTALGVDLEQVAAGWLAAGSAARSVA